MVSATCDLRRGLHAKRWFDPVGHYSRSDVLAALGPTPKAPAEQEPPPEVRPAAP